jgi:Transcriptional regulator containing an amidase domain and an AraC-type DNA-binding HTH domain
MKTSENLDLSHEVILPQAGKDVNYRITADKISYVSSHWHNALELIYIISGELEVTIANEAELLKQGDFTVINSTVVHSTKCLRGNEAILLQIPHSFLKRYIPNFDSLIFQINNHSQNDNKKPELMRIKEIFNRMRFLQESDSTSAYLQFQNLLFDLIYHLYQNFSIEMKHLDYNKRAKNLAKLKPIIEYTERYYTKPITINEISGIAALQPKYFCRFFKTSMGSTYIEYLNELRLSYIYRDLISTNIPLVRLLEIHGFTNYKLFRRMFRERFHDTSSHIRKRNMPVY